MRRCPSCGITTTTHVCLECWAPTVLLPDTAQGHDHGMRYPKHPDGCLRSPGWTSGPIVSPPRVRPAPRPPA